MAEVTPIHISPMTFEGMRLRKHQGLGRNRAPAANGAARTCMWKEVVLLLSGCGSLVVASRGLSGGCGFLRVKWGLARGHWAELKEAFYVSQWSELHK